MLTAEIAEMRARIEKARRQSAREDLNGASPEDLARMRMELFSAQNKIEKAIQDNVAKEKHLREPQGVTPQPGQPGASGQRQWQDPNRGAPH